MQVTQEDIFKVMPLCLRHRLRKDPLEQIDSGEKARCRPPPPGSSSALMRMHARRHICAPGVAAPGVAVRTPRAAGSPGKCWGQNAHMVKS